MSNILNIFYNEIIKEASTGRVDCFFMFNILFNTKIPESNIDIVDNTNNNVTPTLIIRNKSEFNSLLTEYVKLAKSSYSKTNVEEEIRNSSKNGENDIDKMIMTLLFANATYDDFENPNIFLKRQIAFLKDETFDEYMEEVNLGYSEVLESDVIVRVSKERLSNEAINSLDVSLLNKDNGEKYYLPHLRFGIDNGNAWIYAIQSDKKEVPETPYQKKVKRKLYKVGEGFDFLEDNYENYNSGNLNDITPSFVLIANIFLSLAKKENITNITVPSILCERWIAKERTIKEKSKRMDEPQKEEFTRQEQESHVILQSNLTEKFLRTFLRVIHHYENYEVTAYPFEGDSSLHFSTDGENICNNKLLEETSNMALQKSKIL